MAEIIISNSCLEAFRPDRFVFYGADFNSIWIAGVVENSI